MKFKIEIVVVFFLILLTFRLIALDKREGTLIGTWKESEWTFGQIRNPHVSTTEVVDTASTELKKELGKNLLLHTAESWKFNVDNRLYIKKGNEEYVCRWYIKGRGNILEIKNENNGITETYEIVRLSDDSLVISFDVDRQMQGLAKMKFKRI